MAGHNKWAQIKHQKGAADKKRGALFSKLVHAIGVTAKNGADPNANISLRSAIEAARTHGVSKDTIAAALARAKGEVSTEEITIEAYDESGVALIVIANAASKARTLAEIKKIFVEHHAKPAEPGSVRWAFTEHKEKGEWVPAHRQPITADQRTKLSAFVAEIASRDDVRAVYENSEPTS